MPDANTETLATALAVNDTPPATITLTEAVERAQAAGGTVILRFPTPEGSGEQPPTPPVVTFQPPSPRGWREPIRPLPTPPVFDRRHRYVPGHQEK